MARYAWILKHEDGRYVRVVHIANGTFTFTVGPEQRFAARFCTHSEAVAALQRRSAWIGAAHSWSLAGDVRVVRLKLKEKT
jgi:hypothetical protein